MTTFATIHTSYGLQRMAQAEAAGVPINLTHMAVGDGNGNPTTPTEGQTVLVRELFRATVNCVYQDPAQPAKFTAELVIPATIGGFTLREVGVYDDKGSLFAVGNLPATYKPNSSEGAYSDTVVRMEFQVMNASLVTIIVDTNVAIASQAWVLINVTGANLIPGGTTGQILTKDSNADGKFSWHDPNVANVVVDVIEERQTLTSGQTVITLTTVTTRGLAVYVEGVRIAKGAGAGEWQESPTDPDTKVMLGQSYPDVTRILMTQNEPSGSVPFPLVCDQNLEDIPNKFIARKNLDVFSCSETRQMAPPGVVAHFARNTAPAGWLKANGAAISRTAYADLFAAIGTTFGIGDGFNTFNLPDLRGEFVRSWDDGRGIDVGRAFGAGQNHAFQDHTHEYTRPLRQNDTDRGTGNFSLFSLDNEQTTSTVGTSGSTASETRPRNMVMLACIKF